ncbi:hypothetical protein PR003_g5704 [Phytophthora rubi]|uniref:Uncharacterized protein n=2 Tax=Phytophthora TaxID=4783 RepID=A0A6A4FIP6_9STRA|nr:hypothetical protein PR003_g5704 [Phytophthora rubi]
MASMHSVQCINAIMHAFAHRYIRGDLHWTMLQVHCHLAHTDEDSLINGYVPGSRVRVNLVIEYVAGKKSGHDVVCLIKHVSALTSIVNEYSKVDML